MPAGRGNLPVEFSKLAGNDLSKVKSGSAVLLAAMNGVWRNAFSIKNFDIGDLVLGFGGRVNIGKILVADCYEEKTESV